MTGQELEIERLLVRLVGDATDYLKMLHESQKATKDAADDIARSAKQIEAFGDSVKHFGESLGAGLAAYGAGHFLHEVFNEFAEAETVALKLTAIMEANGREVEKLTGRYEAFSMAMQDLTIYGDTEIKSMLQQAEALGLTGASAMRAAKNVIAARAAGIHGFGMRQATQLEHGQINPRLARTLGLEDIGTDSEKAAKAQEKLAAAFKAAEAEAGTTTGTFKQFRNVVGNIYEDLGKTVDSAVKPFVKGIKDLATWFRDLSGPMKNVIKNTILISAGVLMLTGAIIAAGIAFNTFFGGIGIIAAAVVAGIVLISFVLAEVIEDLGGFNVVWGSLQAGVAAFISDLGPDLKEMWDWIAPLAMELTSLGITVIKDVLVANIKLVMDEVRALRDAFVYLKNAFPIVSSAFDAWKWDTIRGLLYVQYLLEGPKMSFGAYAAKKVMEMNKALAGVTKVAAKAGLQMGEDFADSLNKGSKGGLEKWEAALFGSAEHMARTLAYQAGMPGAGSGMDAANRFLHPDAANTPTIMGATAVDTGPSGMPEDEEILKVLKDIAETLKKTGGPFGFGPANLQ